MGAKKLHRSADDRAKMARLNKFYAMRDALQAQTEHGADSAAYYERCEPRMGMGEGDEAPLRLSMDSISIRSCGQTNATPSFNLRRENCDERMPLCRRSGRSGR